MSPGKILRDAPVAQWIEQQPSKLFVGGSNPLGGAIKCTLTSRLRESLV